MQTTGNTQLETVWTWVKNMPFTLLLTLWTFFFYVFYQGGNPQLSFIIFLIALLIHKVDELHRSIIADKEGDTSA